MAGNFNLTAQIHLQAPNAKQFARNLQKQLQNPNIKVNLQGAPKTVKDLNNVAKATKDVEKASQRAGKGADYMGRQLGSAFKQIMKYDIARRVFSLFANAIEQGVKDAIAFERAMVKVAQVSGATAREMKTLENAISGVATSLGVSSSALARTSLILKQTGLSMKDTRIAMQALAKTELAPTFDNIADTAEMAVAAMRQFGMEARQLEGLLGKINVVAANFAVESSDIGVAIRRAGGAFKAAGGEVEELIALFTSVRATTRETAETIATGFRTIFTRLQRPTTIKFLQQFGIELTDLSGKFIGPYKAVEELNRALKNLDPRDLRYSMIVEQLGGFRQVSKVIPLIQQFGTAQAALNAQQAESGSLARDAAMAQDTLAVKMQKLNEEVKELFREIVGSDAFQMMASGALKLASAIVKVADALAPVIPLITAFAGFKMAGWATSKFKMFGGSGIGAATGSMGGTGGPGFFNRGGRVHRFSRGGWVPGSGNGDTVPALLEPGEFVLRKSAAQAFGPQLASVNRYAGGGAAASQFTQTGLQRRVIQSQVSGLYKKADTPFARGVQFNDTDRFSFAGYDTQSVSFREKKSGKKGIPSTFAAVVDGVERSLSTTGAVAAKNYLRSKSGPNYENALVAAGFMKSGGNTGGTNPFDGKLGDTYVEARSRKKNTTERHVIEKGIQEAIKSGIPVPSLTAKKNRMTLPMSAMLIQDSSKFAKGGLVPSLLTPGEFVVNKKSAQRMGYGKLSQMNRFASGGAVGVRRYSGGGGVLPAGMGGGMDPMMLMMMFEGLGNKVEKTTKGFGNLIGGLTNAGMGATMAYTKFQFAAQGAGALASAFGMGSETLDAFVGRVGQVGGIIAAITNLVSSPMAQAAVAKGFDFLELAFLTMGDKIPGVVGKAFKKVGGCGARSFAKKGFDRSFFSIPKKFKDAGRARGIAARAAEKGAAVAPKLEAAQKAEKALLNQRKKIADKMEAIAKQRAKKVADKKFFGDQVGKFTREAYAEPKGSAARKSAFGRARAAQTQGVFSKGTIKRLDADYSSLSKNLSKVDDSLKGATKTTAKYASASKTAAARTVKYGAMAGKLGKTALALTGVGLAAIALEETIAYVGRSMRDEAMQQIKEGGADMTEEEASKAITKAGKGGAISGAATGAGIGALLAPWTFGLSIVVGAVIGASIGWVNSVQDAKDALDRVKFEAAVEKMAKTMQDFSEGRISAGTGMTKLASAAAQLNAASVQGGVDPAEVEKQKAQMEASARTLAQAQFSDSEDFEAVKGGAELQRLMQELPNAFDQNFFDSMEKITEKNKEQRLMMEANMRAMKAANKELRALQGFSDVVGEVSRRMINYTDAIGEVTGSIGSRLGDQGRGLEGNMRDPASKKRRSQMYASLGNIAGETNPAFVSGSGLSRFQKKAEDVDFLEGNLKDVLTRSAMGGGLDAESRRSVIAEELKSSLQNEGHVLSDYMDNRINDITRGLSEEDLSDIEGNMDKIYDAYMEGAEEFKEIFKDAADLVNKYNQDLASAYEAQLKLEKEYTQRQLSLMKARFDSEQKYLNNLSASEFAGTSNAAVQGNFKARQEFIARQGGLRGGTGVDQVGASFKQIRKELIQSNKALQNIGLQGAGDLDPNDPLVKSNSELIKKNKELQQEYDAAKTILENYANSQERLTALNKELEQAQQKRKSLRDLAIQARFGTAEQKNQAARLINAITIATQQGIDAVAPELQRDVVGYLPTMLGAEGEAMINQDLNNAFGGGQGMAGITEVSAEERRLATEIKAIEDAGITAGEHLSSEVGDRIKEMASEIERINDAFISEFRGLMLQREERMAKDDIITAEKRVKQAEADQALLDKYGITGDNAEAALTAAKMDAENILNEKKTQEKAIEGDVGFNIKDVATGLLTDGNTFQMALDELENMRASADYGVEGMIDDEDFNLSKGKKLVDLLGLNFDELEYALDEGGGGMGVTGFFGGRANEEITKLRGKERAAYDKAVENLTTAAKKMGMDTTQLTTSALGIDTAKNDAGDMVGAMLKAMADFQDKQGVGGENLKESLDALKDRLGDEHPLIKALESADTEEKRDAILKDIKKLQAIQTAKSVQTRKTEADKDLAAARLHLQHVQQDINTLATKGANPGSIYTHDIHCQAVLLNILSVLEGQGRTVDMGSSAAMLQKGGVDAMASSIKAPMGVQATKNTQAAGIMMSGAMSQEATDKFMNAYGNMSLKDVEDMSLEEKQQMLDAMKDANIPLSQKKELEAIAGTRGLGDFFYGASAFEKSSFSEGGLDEGQTLKDALGPSIVKETIKALSEGAAAGTVAAQTQAALATLGINETAEMFSKNIEEFSSAMGNPLSIEVGGSIEVNVNMNGADFLKNAEGALAEIAGSEASKAINNFIQQMNKSSNVKPNPQGWHQSGQPKPLTGNG